MLRGGIVVCVLVFDIRAFLSIRLSHWTLCMYMYYYDVYTLLDIVHFMYGWTMGR